MKCIARVQAGVCGFATTITADAPDDQMVRIEVETDCQKIASLAEVLRGKEIDGYDEIAKGFDGVVLSAVRASLSGCCAGCAVPVGIFKAMQAAARVALPRDVGIMLEAE
jgi:formylmethanofuran dehydrogenase subunit B